VRESGGEHARRLTRAVTVGHERGGTTELRSGCSERGVNSVRNTMICIQLVDDLRKPHEPPVGACLRLTSRLRCLRLQTDLGLRWSSAFTTESEWKVRARARSENLAGQGEDGVIIRLVVVGDDAWNMGGSFVGYVGLSRRTPRRARGRGK